MADDVTLRLGAEAQQAIDTLKGVESAFQRVVDRVKNATPIYDQFGNAATTATTKTSEGSDRAAKKTDLLATSFGKLTAAFTAASIIDRVIGGLVDMGTEAVASASRILDLKDATGLSTDAIQRLEYVEAKTGTQTGALTDANYKLGLQLAKGNDSTRAAADELGLSWDALQQASPEERFYTVIEALAGVSDESRRNALATELVGKTWKEVAPAAVSGIRSIGAAATVSTEEQLKALSAATAAWRGFLKGLQQGTTEVLGQMVLDFQSAGSGWKKFLIDLDMTRQFGLAGHRMFMEQLAQEQQAQATAAAADAERAKEQAKNQPTQRAATELLKEAEAKVRALGAAKIAEIEIDKRLGVSDEDLRNKYGLSVGALKLVEEAIEKKKKAEEDAKQKAAELTREELARAEALKNLSTGLRTLTQVQYDQIAALLKAGKSESDIAKQYFYTAQEVADVAASEKGRADALKDQTENRLKLLAAATEIERALRKKQEEAAKAAADASLKSYEIAREAEQRLATERKDNLDRRLEKIDQAERAELERLRREGNANSVYYQQAERDIRAHYQLQRDLATGTANTIVQRMRDVGVYTRAELEAQAAVAKRDYDQIRASGEYTWAELRDAEERWHELDRRARGESMTGWQQWTGVLSVAGNAIGQLASALGDELLGTIGDVVSGTEQMVSGFQRMASGDVLGGLQQVISSVINLGQALADALTRSEPEKIAADLRRQFHLAADESDGLTQKINELRRSIISTRGEAEGFRDAFEAGILPRRVMEELRITRGEAMNLLLPDILNEAGGLTARNWETFWNRTIELFNQTRAASGQLREQGLQPLDQMLVTFGQRMLETDGLFTKEFIETLQIAKREGLELAGVTELLDGQMQRAASGLRKTLGGFEQDTAYPLKRIRDLQKEYDDLFRQMRESDAKGEERDQSLVDRFAQINDEIARTRAAVSVTSQEDFDRLSRLTFATFNAYVAQGKSAFDAIAMLGESIDVLRDGVTVLGLQGSEAFNKLARLRELATDNAPLLESIGGLNDLMQALANLGALDADTFKDLQAQGLDAFKQLTAAGFTEQEARQQLAPLLENIIRLHKERGFAIDEETQKLIDQAREDGVLREQQEDTNSILQTGLGQIIQLLGGELPKAWKKSADSAIEESERAARGAERALGGIRVPRIRVPVDFDLPEGADTEGGGDESRPPGFAAGTRGQFPDFGRGTLAVLHGRERIMTEEEGRRDADRAARLKAAVDALTRSDLPRRILSAYSDDTAPETVARMLADATRAAAERTTASTSPAQLGPIYVSVRAGERELRDITVEATQEGLATGRIQVPARAVTARIPVR